MAGDARNELPKEMRARLDALALEMVRDSIVEKATARFIAQIVAEVEAEKRELRSEVGRLQLVRATIYTNARHMGCLDEEAKAYADGTSEKPFIEAMVEYVQARDSGQAGGGVRPSCQPRLENQ